jgi:hypothetical protein
MDVEIEAPIVELPYVDINSPELKGGLKLE